MERHEDRHDDECLEEGVEDCSKSYGLAGSPEMCLLTAATEEARVQCEIKAALCRHVLFSEFQSSAYPGQRPSGEWTTGIPETACQRGSALWLGTYTAHDFGWKMLETCQRKAWQHCMSTH